MYGKMAYVVALTLKLELSTNFKQTIKTMKCACGCRGRERAPNSVVLSASIVNAEIHSFFIIHFSLTESTVLEKTK